MNNALKRIKPYIENYPFIANTYRVIRDSWVVRRSKPRLTPYGFKLIGNREMQEGKFEEEETFLIQSYLPNTDVFVDIGANIGFYTCFARHANKHVISIEPEKTNLLYLYLNLIGNGWKDVEVYPIGLSDHAGIGRLYGSGTGASTLSGWAGCPESYNQFIPLSTLDILLGERFQGKQMFIKLDAEGSEFNVLEGATKTLNRCPRPIWLVEIGFTEHHPNALNTNFSRTFETFWSLGYEAQIAKTKRKQVSPSDVKRWVGEKRCEYKSNNYVFVPKTP
jgi:FkbM family methyltransferase